VPEGITDASGIVAIRGENGNYNITFKLERLVKIVAIRGENGNYNPFSS